MKTKKMSLGLSIVLVLLLTVAYGQKTKDAVIGLNQPGFTLRNLPGDGNYLATNVNTDQQLNIHAAVNFDCYDFSSQLSNEEVLSITEDIHYKMNAEFEKLKQMKEYQEKAEAIRKSYSDWIETEKLYAAWKKSNYEDTGLGINYTRQMGRSLSGFLNLIPVPESVSPYLKCVFDAIPLLIDKYTDILLAHIKKIDSEIASAENGVSFGDAKCTGNTLTSADVKVIKGLDITDSRKNDLFHRGCFVGLPAALKEMNLLKSL